MRRIDLLPPAYGARRRERRNVTLVVVAGVLVLLLMFGWYLLLGLRVNDARRELSDVQARNATLSQQIAELQRFQELQTEIELKRQALQIVMAGDVDWPKILTEIAMVIPGEVWLTNLQASAGQTEGFVPVGTETAPIRIAAQEPFGRVQFTGKSKSMYGVAKWMVSLERVGAFFAVYLNSSTEEEVAEGVRVFNFNNTLELSDEAASGRFQEGSP